MPGFFFAFFPAFFRLRAIDLQGGYPNSLVKKNSLDSGTCPQRPRFALLILTSG
jgi:hypothetical protein